MDYKRYTYNEKTYDLSPAVKYLKKGDIPGMEKYIRQKLRCTPAEAKQIAEEIGKGWYQNKSGKKSHGGTIAIIIILVLLACGAGGYFYYQKNIAPQPEDFVMVEENPEVNSVLVGQIYGQYDIVYDADDCSEAKHNNLKNLYSLLSESSAQFFIAKQDDESAPPQITSVKKSELEPDEDAYRIGKAVKTTLERTVGEPVSYGTQFEKYAFGGESVKEYFKNRNLKLKCKSLTPKKILSNPGETFVVIYDAEIETVHCDGKSYFPKEGKTKHMDIVVVAGYAGLIGQKIPELDDMLIEKK